MSPLPLSIAFFSLFHSHSVVFFSFVNHQQFQVIFVDLQKSMAALTKLCLSEYALHGMIRTVMHFWVGGEAASIVAGEAQVEVIAAETLEAETREVRMATSVA